MATGGLAAAALTDLLRSQAFPELQQDVYRNNEVFQLFGTRPWLGGTTYPVKHQYSSNGSFETYTEGDQPPSPQSQGYITANWPEAHYQGTGQITGHAMDYSLGGAPAAMFFDQIGHEVRDAIADGINKAATDMIGSGLTAPVGILGIIDDAGTIAGLSRTTYTWFKAVENTPVTGNALVISDLDILQQDITDSAEDGNPGRPDTVLASYKQERVMRSLGFIPGSTSNSLLVPIGPNGPQVNIGYQPGSIKYGDMPVVPLRGFTNSVVCMLERAKFFIAQLRPWTVDQLAKVDDTSKFYITAAFGLVCLRPRTAGKLTTLTA